jgi:hypothetical protein
VISEKQLLAEAGREKKSTRRKERTDKQNDKPNVKKKQKSRKELTLKKEAGFTMTRQGTAVKSHVREAKKVR